MFTTTRSFQRTFDLHSCLPRRVRRLPPHHAEYGLLARLVEELSDHLRSTSRAHLQKIALFLDAMVRGWLAWGTDVDATKRWSDLAGMTARQWLLRLADVYGGQRRLAFEHFKRLVRYLHLLHARVFGNAEPHIPLPSSGGRFHCAEGLHELTSTDGGGSASDAPGRRDVRELLGRVRASLCRLPGADGEPLEERLYAFTPTEARAVVDAAASSEERLVMLLLFTTALRIGGLARLQLVPTPDATPQSPTAVPEHAVTTEKGGKVRRVRLTAACRILLYRYYRQGRRAAGSPYVFASPVTAEGPLSTRYLWGLCREVFRRAGLAGKAHAHPHTIRHTVIQMLYMKGMSFEEIAKWVGHAHPSVTSGVYGRLSQENVNATLRGLPFADTGRDDVRKEWSALATYLAAPYVFKDDEWAGLRPNLAPPAKQRHAGDTGFQDVVRRLIREELARQ